MLQVNGGQARVDLFAALRGVMYLQKRHTESRTDFISRAAAELEAVYTRFADQKVYVDYHRKQYGSTDRIGKKFGVVPLGDIKNCLRHELLSL
jgi:hypothetical protein